MPGTTTDMKKLLFGCPSLPGTLLTSLYESAKAAGNIDLLQALIAREDAPADLVAKFALEDDPELAAVFARRHIRSGAPARQPQTNPTRLVELLKGGGLLPAAVVQDATAVLLTRPTKALASALYRYNRPHQLSAEAARVVLEHTQFVRALDAHRTFARLGPVHGRQLLTSTTRLWHVPWLAAFDLPYDEVVAATARGLVTELASPGNDNRARAVLSQLAHVMAIWHAAQASHLRDDLVWQLGSAWDNPRVQGFTRSFLLDVNAWVSQPVRTQWTRVWDTAPVPVISDTGVDVAAMSPAEWSTVAVSSDPTLVAQLAAMVWSAPFTQHSRFAWKALLTNPQLTAADRRELVAWATRVGDCPTGSKPGAIELYPDVVGMFPRDEHVKAMWCQFHPAQVLDLHGWEPFGGRSAAVELLAGAREGLASAAWSEVGATPVLCAIARHGVDEDMALALDPRLRSRALAIPAPHADTFAKAVAKVMAKVAADPARWAVFFDLLDTFGGTLGELLTVVDAVVAAPAS